MSSHFNGTVIRVFLCIIFFFGSLVSSFSVTIDEVMEAALKNDYSLADAKSRLRVAENNLFKSASLYNSSLSLSSSLKGQGSDSSSTSSTPDGATSSSSDTVQKSFSASLDVPLARWISLGVEGSTDTEEHSGSLSLSLTPLAKADTQAEISWNKAVIDAQNAVRTTLLAVRKEYRAVLTSQSEYEFKKASVLSAENELSRVQYLAELGSARKSDEITVYSDLLDAQGELDIAENNVNLAIQNLLQRTGLDALALADITALTMTEGRTLVTEETWLSRSADMANAKLSLESVKIARTQGTTLPGLSLGTTVDDSLDWSVTAKVSFSPDLIFQKTKDTANENLNIEERAYANTEWLARVAWKNQQNALAMAERNYANANRFIESAQLSFTETSLLLERGESSRASLDTANENLLSAKYQRTKAIESLENARDALDEAWQLSL